MASTSQHESAAERTVVPKETGKSYHDTTCMPLMPHMLRCKNKITLIFWLLVLGATLCPFCTHFACLIKEYKSYKKHSKVEMVSDKFEFPSVTFCNINPMRMSQKEKVDKKLQELIEAIDPRVIIKSLNNYTSNSYLNKTFGETPPTLDDVYAFMNWSSGSQTDSSPIKCQDCEDLFTKRSPPNKIQYTFAEYYSELNETIRRQVGHQLEDMILRCFFEADYCKKSHFKPMLSEMYGNCYTWSNNNAVSLYNGRNRGLEVTLHLETMEYIPGAKNSEGLTLIIHEQGTYPSPWDEGITLSGGTLAFISLKMSKIQRLDQPYGPCESSDSFKEQYGWKYSLNLCYKICEQKDLRKRCGCIDTMESEINAILKNPDNLRNCSYADKKDYDCIHMDYDTSTCQCNSPCSETVYSKQVSYNRWPTTHFEDVLVAKICQDKSNETCDRAKNRSHEHLMNDFLHVIIFFENPGFDMITEEKEMTLSTLGADIGGAIGLWLGLSVIGGVELLYYLFCYYFCSNKPNSQEDAPLISADSSGGNS